MEERGSGRRRMPIKPVGTTVTGRPDPPLAVPTNKHAHAVSEEMTREGESQVQISKVLSSRRLQEAPASNDGDGFPNMLYSG